MQEPCNHVVIKAAPGRARCHQWSEVETLTGGSELKSKLEITEASTALDV